MKIQYCSDLHMEFDDNKRLMDSLPLDVAGDILVIAGDSGYLNDPSLTNLKFWEWASRNYRQVLLVAGNHEFYNNGDITAYGDSWQLELLPNVTYYHNKAVRIDNIDFILTTLWSQIPKGQEGIIQDSMNDYYHILYNNHSVTPHHINEEFQKNINFVKKAVKDSSAEKIVVVTHHLPTFDALLGRRKDNETNPAYATELSNYISGSRISAWIYGHSHFGTDLMIGNTHLVSNPLGYVFCGQHIGFSKSAIIEV